MWGLSQYRDAWGFKSASFLKNEVRVMVAYPDRLIHEREFVYGLVVVSHHRSSIVPNPCDEHTLQAFTRNMESDHNIKILWVAKDPHNTAENEKLCDLW